MSPGPNGKSSSNCGQNDENEASAGVPILSSCPSDMSDHQSLARKPQNQAEESDTPPFHMINMSARRPRTNVCLITSIIIV